MKKGKYYPLGYHENVKIGFGTIDFKNIKSIYIDFNTWILPKNEVDFDRIISKSRKKIIRHFLSSKDDVFKKESIVNLDISTKGVKLNKTSFMCLEITLYVNNKFDIKSDVIKETVLFICKTIIDEHLTDKNLFNFHRQKKLVSILY